MAHPAEKFLLSNKIKVINLLTMGIPYLEIMQMSEEEINDILGITIALREKAEEEASG